MVNCKLQLAKNVQQVCQKFNANCVIFVDRKKSLGQAALKLRYLLTRQPLNSPLRNLGNQAGSGSLMLYNFSTRSRKCSWFLNCIEG